MKSPIAIGRITPALERGLGPKAVDLLSVGRTADWTERAKRLSWLRRKALMRALRESARPTAAVKT